MALEQFLDTIHPDWELPGLSEILGELDRRAAEGEFILPDRPNVLRALQVPPSAVRVLIVGQDPYPTPGHAVGLAFSAELPAGEPLPKSLNNIYKEYSSDLGLPVPTNGDLSPWIDQGVLLLNRVLTVSAGQAGSHRNIGWEAITDSAVGQIAGNDHLAAILWGKQAQQFVPTIGEQRCVTSPHPSPLSAYRGFFGSRPFTRANAILSQQGADPVNWDLGR
ncbi:MAG TPA: uracil-DNA glycosylase [Candidatus Corynebacterium gallistercoris]|uniref:Uracil-DNA glycosylase n=1 Tax=Candidatus Corynebacterium gallistercoris TaxID=2838530 RepID=A0A9D1UQR2_9CORY|nr:uracil-DNA glycosylase [Candidatus Corynebacterium gallistercoris]